MHEVMFNRKSDAVQKYERNSIYDLHSNSCESKYDTAHPEQHM